MDYIADTNAILFFNESDSRISNKAKDIIKDMDNNIYISIASFWEISIKFSIGKLELSKPLDIIFEDIFRNNFIPINININHIIANSRLLFHHRDPFDRIIIAQAVIENLPIITSDILFEKYPINRIW